MSDPNPAMDPAIDPEVLAIMHEVIADPNSALTHLPKVKCATLLGLREEKISASSSFLSNAEKHLLQRYRDEAAYLLNQECTARLGRADCASSGLHDHAHSSPPDPRRVARARTRLIADREEAGQRAADALAPRTIFASGVEELATISLAIRPSDRTRNILALTLDTANRQDAARAVALDILSHGTNAVDRKFALTNLGYFSSNDPNREHQRSWYRRAALEPEPLPESSLNWLLVALVTGDEQEIEAACSRADECVSESTPELAAFNARLRSNHRTEQLEFSNDAKRRIQRLASSQSPVTRSIANAVIQA